MLLNIIVISLATILGVYIGYKQSTEYYNLNSDGIIIMILSGGSGFAIAFMILVFTGMITI